MNNGYGELYGSFNINIYRDRIKTRMHINFAEHLLKSAFYVVTMSNLFGFC